MPSQIVTNGWDMIAAGSQDAINAQLAKIPAISANQTLSLDLLPGFPIPIHFNVKFFAPQIHIRELSGRLVDILLPVSGTIGFNVPGAPSSTYTLPPGEILTVTTSLTYLEAGVTQQQGVSMTTLNLVLDFESPDLIADLTSNIDPTTSAVVVEGLKQYVQKYIGNGKQYTLTSVSLPTTTVTEFKALIPYLADFTFVQNATNPGRSNLLVLMQSVTQGRGSVEFANPILPDGQDFMFIISNKVFLQYFVLPSMIKSIKAKAKSPSDVPNQLAIHAIAGQQDMFEIQNNASIAVNMDHNPWISSVTGFVDQGQAALQLYLDVQANVTIFNFHVDTSDRSWQQFKIDSQGNISLVQVKDEQNKSTNLDWWEWLLGVITGPITLIVEGVLLAVVNGDVPNLGGSLTNAQTLVRWPNQKHVLLEGITLPGHLAMNLQVSF